MNHVNKNNPINILGYPFYGIHFVWTPIKALDFEVR